MRFGSPEYFALFLALPVLVGFFIWAHQRRQNALRRFAASELVRKLTPSFDSGRQIAKWVLFLVFFSFLVLALTRPRFGVIMEMVERKGVDVIVALDISQSMLARDIAPNRIDRAKHEIGKLINLLKGDRIGLIVFAGESFLQCPLTLDYGAANMFLNSVSTGWVQMQGTALGDAIKQATSAFRSKARKHKVLILLSDGEDHEGNAIEQARAASDDGVVIYTVGIGSENGVPIPVNQGSGNVVYKKNKSGNLVMTRLNPVMLEKIALEGRGKYFHAGTDLDLVRVYAEISKMEKKDLGMTKASTYEERYQFLLLFALIFLIIEFFIPARRAARQEVWKGRFE